MQHGSNALLSQFCSLLTGRHSNQQQAFDNPPLFAHIVLKYRALPQFSTPTLLLEQSYAVSPEKPYRVRVLQVRCCEEAKIRVTNHTLRDPSAFLGAADCLALRATIRTSQLNEMHGCGYEVMPSGVKSFIGTTEPGCRCLVTRNKVETYLQSSFKLHPDGMNTLDRGYHLKTHERVWGSVAGEFVFRREEDWSDEIPEQWWDVDGRDL